MKVNFLIIGTQKGGTTALAKFLSNHPQVYLPSAKEVHFFDNEGEFSSAQPNYEKYHAAFSNYSGEKVMGEATPIYMYIPKIAERIRHYNPYMKLICILRNPIDRAYSHYQMTKRRHIDSLPFSIAIRIERIRLLTKNSSIIDHSYIDRGYYARQIRNIIRYFAREQMLFIKTEDLHDRREETLHLVYDFLNLDHVEVPKFERVFSFDYASMNPRDRKYLLRRYSEKIVELESMLHWNLSNWKI